MLSIVVLPDLIPNITAIQQSVTIQDRYMGYLSCSMEENCLASSAYTLKDKNPRSMYDTTTPKLKTLVISTYLHGW